MNFDLSDEQTMLRDAAERFIRDEYGFEERRKLAGSDEGFSRAHWRQFADLGWLGLNLPEDVGGLGCSFVETALLLEQFGRGMVLEPYLATAVLCSRLIDASGNPALREALLPRLVSGELLLALAHEEWQFRHAPDVPATRARRNGAGYKLDGHKTMVLAAAAADRLIVSAQIDETRELGLFVLDHSTPGVHIDSYALVCGQRAGDVRLEAAACPADALLARGDVARQVLDDALDRARLGAMAQALGAIEASLEVSSEYIKTRVQFGQPLSKFQALQHLMADMFVDTQESRSILYQGLAHIEGEPVRRQQAVSAAKIVIGEAGRRVSASGIQLHGGYGTTDEYLISHYFRWLFVLEKLFGDAEYHAERFTAEISSNDSCPFPRP